MSIRCQCTNCGATYNVSDQSAGKKIKCAKCATIFPVVAPGGTAPAPAAAAPTASILPKVNTGANTTVAPRRQAPAPPAPQPLPASAFPSVNASANSSGVMSGINIKTGSPGGSSAASSSVLGSGVGGESGFVVNTRSPAAAFAPPSASQPQPLPKKGNPLIPALIGSAALLVIGLGGVGYMVFAPQFSDEPKKIASTDGGSTKKVNKKVGTIVLDWPDNERKDCKLTLDNKTRTFPVSGPIELNVAPGKHVVAILRRGYEPVTISVDVVGGERATRKPDFKEASGTAIASNTNNNAGNTGTNFQVGSAVVPPGFEGWEQSLINAKNAAQQGNKDILLLFGSSDGSPVTNRAAKALRDAGLPGGDLAKTIIPVVIDFPTTSAGRNHVVDLQQNVELAKEYRITSMTSEPTLVMLDSKGRPYAIQRELPKGGVTLLPTTLATLQKERASRDTLLAEANAGTPEDQLKGAGKFVEWLEKQEFVEQYGSDIALWYAQASRLDADNGKGLFEIFTVAHLRCLVRGVETGNVVELNRMLGSFDDWLARKFNDPDRGVRLHLIIGMLLGRSGDEDRAFKHLERAATYTPKDTELAEQLRGLKGMLENRSVVSSGTGFVIAKGGYMLTNRHVIEGDGKIQVRIPNVKDPIPASLIAVAPDADPDMALIKAEFPVGFDPVPIPLVPGKLGRGLEVAAFGYPQGDFLGRGLKFTKGSISDLPNEQLDNMVLLDIRINPGNSGGPLLASTGEVIGMITAKTGGDTRIDSYGMAVPTEELQKFLEKHLPKSAVRGAASDGTVLTWDKVDQRVSPSVLMILKVED